METLSHSTTITSPLDHMSSPDSQFLKMEDLHNPSSASPAPSASDNGAWPHSSPAPVFVTSKPAKKRKSWGQELPEPKTALPPRKRAKTDDEKEQRRIERIKRNRAAAHNSRERKRQETEDLAVKLARANAELDAYRQLHGALPAHIVLPEVHVKVEYDESGPASASTPAPSLVESHGSHHDAPSPASPADDVSYHHIKTEPQETPVQFTLPAYDSSESKSMHMPFDLTQHSAAMLCDDLPCRSNSMSNTLTLRVCWSNMLLYLMAFQLQTCYKTLLIAMWTLSPSRMARMMQASMLRSSRLTNSSTMTRTLRSTPRRLAQCNTATGQSAPLPRQSIHDESQKSSRGRGATKRAHAHQTGQALGDRINEHLAMGDDEGYESNGVED